jgi:demethylmenaquinone methyltransferase/2-methoxy-6-polyprenyl-1,4-benzoquinol methylase
MNTMAKDRKWYKWFYDNIHSRQYDLLIRWFLWPWGGEKKFRQEMMEPVELFPNDRILDLCCGTGSSTFIIREKAGENAEIIGCDLSTGQIKRARKKNRFSNVRFIEADATNTGFGENYFDKVFIPHALHEMPRELRLKVLIEARRVLKVGGKLIIFELDNPDSPKRRLLLGLWLGYWLPYPLNFENRTRRDMLRYGVIDEVREVGFRNVQKISKFQRTMQVVIGEK